MHQIELENSEFNGALEHRIDLHVGVDFHESGHDEQEAVRGKYVLKVIGRVDVDGETGAHHVKVLAMKEEGAVDDGEEEGNVPGRGGLSVHRGEERPDELTPGVLVEHVSGKEFTVGKFWK